MNSYYNDKLYPLQDKILKIFEGRDEPKDVVDIIVINENQTTDWKKIFTDANSKAVGIFPPMITQKLAAFPVDLISKIKWINQPWTQTESKEKIDKLIASILSVS